MKAKAFAKINLFLQVAGKRPDGYHNIHTLFQQISLYDELTFLMNSGDKIRLFCSHRQVPGDETNLVVKAAQLLREAAIDAGKRTGGVKIYLTKNIPVGAGLGGGSSDAATTLLVLNKLWKLRFPFKKLQELAASIGSDVPFFLYGGVAEAEGRGEKIVPVKKIPSFRIIIVKPSFSISTAWAYQNLVLKHLTKSRKNIRIISKYLKRKDWPRLGELLHNDLEEVCVKRYPFILTLKQRLRNEGAEVVLMSGSGSAMYAFVPNTHVGQHIKEVLRQEKDLWFWSGTTITRSRRRLSCG